jgi:RimJ/RimL family protein N-acetyltransferase
VNNKWQMLHNCLHGVLEQQSLFPEMPFVQSRNDTSHISIAAIGEHFSRTLYLLQQNSDIRLLTRLGRLLSVDHTREWIRGQMHYENKYTFAVIHNEYGMIGIVAFEQYGNGAHFYYWIGEEFQNLGFGSTGLRLLINASCFKGVELIFSSVFEHNDRSKHVLLKQGFKPLSGVYEIGTELLPVYYKNVPGTFYYSDENARSVYENIAGKAGICIKK